MAESAFPPRVSIIIATWNAARTFEQCILSITSQTFDSWELLVSDGGSTDGTVELIGKHSRQIAWWRSERDVGIYDAWSRAIPHARGEYVCFLGADDGFASVQSLAVIFSAVGRRQFDLVTSRGRMTGPGTGKGFVFGSPWNYERLGPKMVVCHPGLLHHRSLFEKFGLFDKRYRIAGDLEFLLRLPKSTWTLHVDVVTVMIDGGGISRTRVLLRLQEQRLILERCARYGSIKARLIWLDKLWRYPVARLFGISH